MDQKKPHQSANVTVNGGDMTLTLGDGDFDLALPPTQVLPLWNISQWKNGGAKDAGASLIDASASTASRETYTPDQSKRPRPHISDFDGSRDFSIHSLPTPISRSSITSSPLTKTEEEPGRKRKGHTKSRRGCYNCKQRKVKCQETRPSCSNCISRKLHCVYPPIIFQPAKNVRSDGGPSLSRPKTEQQALEKWRSRSLGALGTMRLQDTPTVFSLQDMKLFHHFIEAGHPHLPVGNDHVWVSDVCAFAHQYDFLLHAMLALSASHLGAVSRNRQQTQPAAVHHRQLALCGLRRAMSSQITASNVSKHHLDAMLATCYALTFQSGYMRDGLTDFLTMVRGCALMTVEIIVGSINTAFKLGDPDGHMSLMTARMRSLGVLRQDLAQGLELVVDLKSKCNNEVEREWHRHLVATLRNLTKNLTQAYASFVEIYTVLTSMSNTSFQEFINPSNQVSQVLIGHFVALHWVLAPASLIDRMQEPAPPINDMLAWIEDMYWNIDPSMRLYLDWPKNVMGVIYQNAITRKVSEDGRLPKTPWFTKWGFTGIADHGPHMLEDSNL